jgi:MFS family permease
MNAGWRRRLADPLVRSVNALGITQITAWGTSYYCLGVLAKPIAADTGWAISTIFLGFSVALVTMGVISTSVGRLIDRIGARMVMSIGTIVVSGGLLGLSQVHDVATYFAAWLVIGIGMRCCLYDAAFAALVQAVPSRGRAAISYLTLYGAYASTVFWVIGHYLNTAYGWRGTLLIFAGINLVVCLPLNWLGLSRREPAAAPAPDTQAAPPQAPASSEGPALEGRMRVVGIALFALIMSLNGFVFGVVSLQLVPLLEAGGLAGATAVWVASGRDLLRPEPQSHDHRAHRHRRPPAGAAAAPAGARPVLAARHLHAAARRFAGGDHDRARCRTARAVRHPGLWRGAGADRDADPAGQRLLSGIVRADRRHGRLAQCTLRAARLLDADLARHRTHVALVRRRTGRTNGAGAVNSVSAAD